MTDKLDNAWAALGRLRERAAGGNAADSDCNTVNEGLRALEQRVERLEKERRHFYKALIREDVRVVQRVTEIIVAAQDEALAKESE